MAGEFIPFGPDSMMWMVGALRFSQFTGIGTKWCRWSKAGDCTRRFRMPASIAHCKLFRVRDTAQRNSTCRKGSTKLRIFWPGISDDPADLFLMNFIHKNQFNLP